MRNASSAGFSIPVVMMWVSFSMRGHDISSGMGESSTFNMAEPPVSMPPPPQISPSP